MTPTTTPTPTPSLVKTSLKYSLLGATNFQHYNGRDQTQIHLSNGGLTENKTDSTQI